MPPCAAVSDSSSADRSEANTRPPRCAKVCAIQRPNPWPPPVTATVLPSKRMFMAYPLCMGISAILGIAAAGVAIGLAIGATGIGGVLLVPILTMALGIDVKHAIAATLLSFLPGCVVAVTMY